MVNKDNENSAKKVKGSEEAVEVIKEIEKIIEVTNAACYDGWPTNKGKYMKHLKPTINL